LLSDSANCTVLHAVVLTQYRRVTDIQTDGIAVASSALAMRALRCALKIRQMLLLLFMMAVQQFQTVSSCQCDCTVIIARVHDVCISDIVVLIDSLLLVISLGSRAMQ